MDIIKADLKKYKEKVYFLQWFHCTLIFCALFIELRLGAPIFKIILEAIFLGGVYHLYFKVIKQLFYTYWTFSISLIIYVFFGIYNSIFLFESSLLLYTYLLCLIGFSIQMYLLNSPIFYPRAKWWEYEFRYRDEIKIKAEVEENKEVEGRLTDLRRSSGCVQLFQDLEIGKIIKIFPFNHGSEEYLEAQLVSKRVYSLGRPYFYGVKFLLNTKTQKQKYIDIMRTWKNDYKSKSRKKFKRV